MRSRYAAQRFRGTFRGGFTGTETRFSLYFPPADSYRGRFFSTSRRFPTASTSPSTRRGARTRSGSPSPAARTSWRPTAADGPRYRAARSTPPSPLAAPMRLPHNTPAWSPPGSTARIAPTDTPTAAVAEDTGSSAAPNAPRVRRLAPGDSSLPAAQAYHRHQVPDATYTVWDQFRDRDGNQVPPQRDLLLGPLFTSAASGHLPTGEFAGKMIVVACLLDREAFPWQADRHLIARAAPPRPCRVFTHRHPARPDDIGPVSLPSNPIITQRNSAAED